MRKTFAALAVMTACLAAPARAYAQEFVSDPFESFNRHMFAVHEAIDKAVIEPVARGYRYITPRPVRSGVTNFLNNLESPTIFANDVLQGHFRRAGVTAARFGVNTTVGVLGLFDPARSMGLQRHADDFGMTLAVWGVSSGPYVFVPVFGPTNIRDGAGQLIDVVLDPLNWAHFHGDDTFRATRLVMTGISEREGLIEEVDDVRGSSLDPYVTIRSSYGLLRYSAIQNSRGAASALPNFEEIPPDDATPPAPEGQQPPPEQPPQTPQGQAPGSNPQTPPPTSGPTASFAPGDFQ